MGVCRFRMLISCPPTKLWDFLIRPENMHLWGPLTEPVTDLDRPMQSGDRITQRRKDFFREYSQTLLVDELIPGQSLSFRDLSPAGSKLDARAVISVEAAAEPDDSWIEEAIFYSFGQGQFVNWLDRWFVNLLIQLVTTHKTKRAFRRLEKLVGR